MISRKFIRSKTVKITILGDGAVGKSTLIKNLMQGLLEPEELDGMKKTPFIEINTLKIANEKFLIYDLAGQDTAAHPLRVMADQVLGTADIILLAFALDRYTSLAHLESWFNVLHNYYNLQGKMVPRIVLVGTKSDQTKRVDDELIEKVSIGTTCVDYIETSALNGSGIEKLKAKIIQILEETK